MPRKIILPIIVLVVFISLGAGIIIGKYFISAPAVQKKTGPENPLFNSQTATFRGKIKALQGDSLLIVNSTTQTEGLVAISDKIKIAKVDSEVNGKPEVFASLEYEKEVIMTLELIKGIYTVNLIEYIAPQPSLPPLAIPKLN